jgi:peptidoglycan/LPS O-acetylase OafA/YrhL
MKTIQRFFVLDAFRGIAAILVFLYHLPNLSILTKNIFISHSGIFVDLFFVLSGFVIFHNYQHKITGLMSSFGFLKKRFKRLVPLHIYTLLVMVILESVKYALYEYLPFSQAPFDVNTISTLWPQLFLLNSTPLFMGFNWNMQNWSISAEMIAYVLFVLVSILWYIKHLNKSFISIIVIMFGYMFFYIHNKDFNIVSDFNFSFIRGTIGFFVGVLTYLIRERILNHLIKIPIVLYQIFEVLIIVIATYLVSNLDKLIASFYLYHMIFAIIIIIYSMEKGLISQILKHNIFQKLGLWSYSIYLNHIFLIVIFNMIVVKILNIEGYTALFWELLTLIILCIYSSMTYKYIEKRFYKPTIKQNLIRPIRNSEDQIQV